MSPEIYAMMEDGNREELGIEFKITDSSTGKVVVAGMDKRYGKKKLGKGTDSWQDVFNIIDYYVTLLEFRV
jgi:hypothetical protein